MQSDIKELLIEFLLNDSSNFEFSYESGFLLYYDSRGLSAYKYMKKFEDIFLGGEFKHEILEFIFNFISNGDAELDELFRDRNAYESLRILLERLIEFGMCIQPTEPDGIFFEKAKYMFMWVYNILYRFLLRYKPANVQFIELKKSTIKYIVFSGINGDRCLNADMNLYFLDMRCMNLYNAELQNANLVMANLEGANLMKANLVNTNFGMANLKKTNLKEANLTGANLAIVNLIEADLEKADLTDASFDMADLSGANLQFVSADHESVAEAIIHNLSLRQNNNIKINESLFENIKQHLINKYNQCTEGKQNITNSCFHIYGDDTKSLIHNQRKDELCSWLDNPNHP